MRLVPNRMITIAFTALLLIIACAVTPALSDLPPEIEADKLLISVAGKIDSKNFSEAGKNLEKIRALNIKLPVEYFYQNGRYLAGTKQATEAKMNLEVYLDKAGKDGKYYQEALKVYGEVESNEKRLSRFKSNGDGTVFDNQTGLMWAAKDNGSGITWPDAKAYCQNYKAGGHADWRLPTQDELVGLYDKQEEGGHTPLIQKSGCCSWSSGTRGSEATYFDFDYGKVLSTAHNSIYCYNLRALPVRNGK